jgi:hypothetical protein
MPSTSTTVHDLPTDRNVRENSSHAATLSYATPLPNGEDRSELDPDSEMIPPRPYVEIVDGIRHHGSVPEKSRNIATNSPIYCVVFGDGDFVDVSENEYQAGILLAQGHSEETAICLFDVLEETEAMDGESKGGSDTDDEAFFAENPASGLTK